MKRDGRKLISGMILILILITTQIMPAFAETTTEKRTVRVSCGINNALYLDENGQPAGYCASYIRQIAWEENWNLEYVEGSWTDSVSNLYEGKIDILVPTNVTEGREDTMAFSSYIAGYQPIGLFAREDADIYYNDYENLNNKRIAVSMGTSNVELLNAFAKEHGLAYTPVEYNSTQEKKDALLNGDVDLIAFSTFNDVPGAKVVAVLDYLPFYYCTRVDDTELLDELNDGMRKIMANGPDIAGSMYVDAIKSNAGVSYTREENEAIEKSDTLRVGVYKDSLPLSGVDANGNTVGIYADLLKKLEEKSGINIEVCAIDRSINIYDYMNEGNLDFVMGSKNLAYTATDTSNILTSDSIIDYTTVAVSRSDFQFDNAKNPTFALTNGRKYWESNLKENYPQSEIKYYETSKQCLVAVQKSEADATLINTWEYNYQSKNQRFENLIEWESFRMRADLIVGTTTSIDPTILSVIDKAINQMSQEEKDDVIAANMNMVYSSYDTADRIYSMRGMIITIISVLSICIVCLLMYVFFKKKSELALKDKNRELEMANRAKTDFLSRMSHELRTPLNALNGYSELMEQNIVSHELDEELLLQNLSYSQRAAKYLLRIIDDILDVQNVETGKIHIEKEEIDADNYMNNVFHIISQEAEEKGILFTYERKTHISDKFILDGVRLQQIILNVLHNAIKFTPAGGTVSVVAKTVEQTEQTAILQIVVSDTGIGMSREFIENKLFEKFAQENDGIKSPYDGCGIGLAISKQLIELMGGTIECVSEKGKGTTFTITLTAERVENKRARRRGNRPQVNYELPGIKVLLCEDNQMNQDMERKILERMKCEVDIADDGAIGLEEFCNSAINHYNIVLMDIRMPNMDGLEATKAIRALERVDAKTVPILAVSANAFEEDVRESIEAGMNEHLAKPVDARVLYEKIKLYCHLKENKR